MCGDQRAVGLYCSHGGCSRWYLSAFASCVQVFKDLVSVGAVSANAVCLVAVICLAVRITSHGLPQNTFLFAVASCGLRRVSHSRHRRFSYTISQEANSVTEASHKTSK